MVAEIIQRTSPPDEDIDRINETIFRNYGGGIKDEETYIKAYNDYLGINMNETLSEIKDRAFSSYQDRHPQVQSGSIFKKAGGKDLERDRKITNKVIVTDTKDYIKRGATRVDLQDYDTKNALMSKPNKKDFGRLGKVKGVTVYCCESKIFEGKKKERIILRDRRGRFTKGI